MFLSSLHPWQWFSVLTLVLVIAAIIGHLRETAKKEARERRQRERRSRDEWARYITMQRGTHDARD